VRFEVDPIYEANLTSMPMQLVRVLTNDKQGISRFVDFLRQSRLDSPDIECIDLPRRRISKDEVEIRVCMPRFEQILVVFVIVVVETDEHVFPASHPISPYQWKFGSIYGRAVANSSGYGDECPAAGFRARTNAGRFGGARAAPAPSALTHALVRPGSVWHKFGTRPKIEKARIAADLFLL